MQKLGSLKKHGIASILTVLVLGILLVLGPASAVTLNASVVGSSTVNGGQSVTFDLSVDLNSGERVPFQTFRLEILDPSDNLIASCEFSPSGTTTNCPGQFSVSLQNSPSPFGYGYLSGSGYGDSGFMSTVFGYGYGYGYTGGGQQNLRYQVSYTTSNPSTTTTYTARFLGEAGANSVDFDYISQQNPSFTVNRVSSGGSSSGGSSSTPSQTVQQVKQIIGLDDSKNVVSYTASAPRQTQKESVTLDNSFIDNIEDNEVRDVLRQLQSNSQSSQAQVSTTARSYRVVLNDGTVEFYTVLERTIDLTGKEGPVRVVEVIPKEVFETASQMLGDFEVLLDDPIVAFTAQGGSMFTYSYTIPSEIMNSYESINVFTTQQLATTPTEPTEPTTPSEPTPEEPSQPVDPSEPTEPTTPVDTTQQDNGWLVVVLVLVVLAIVIGGLVYFARRKANK